LPGNPWEFILTKLVGEAGVLGNDLQYDLIWNTIEKATEKQQVSNVFLYLL